MEIETKQLEKEYPIEVIASTFENRLLAKYDLIEDFWSFITNENVNLSNINRFLNFIKEEVMRQNPNLKILSYSSNQEIINEQEIEKINNWYKMKNGDFIVIKSLKKGYTKTLKNSR